VGNLAHWLMGLWVEQLGPRGGIAAAYYPIYGTPRAVYFALIVRFAVAESPAKRGNGFGKDMITPNYFLADLPVENTDCR